MSIFQALFLGTIQGITEFLPISSSGHLVFFPKLFGWSDQGLAFDVVVHLGSLVAVIVYFRHKLWEIFTAMILGVKLKVKSKKLKDDSEESIVQSLKSGNSKLGWLIILTIIPAGLVGLLFGDWIEVTLRSASVVGVGLIFWGVVLGVADYVSKKLKVESKKSVDDMGWKRALFIGCAQAIALIPGTSRSGITMTAGLFSKLDKKSAAEFSFLMSVPIIALAGFLKIIELFQNGLGDLQLVSLVVGFISAALSGFVAIWGLMKIIQKRGFMPFVYYRIVVGILILMFLV